MPEQADVVLSVNNVKKRFKDKWIIKGVSFQIFAGEIFGFLGPNGSGKTTTIRMLVDLIKPTEGTIMLCGKDVQREHDEALRHVGSIVENPEMYSYLTGWENLEQFARMMPGVTKQRILEVVKIVGLTQSIHDKVKTYSLGMRQRLGIAQALLGKPKLLILDEPTNGLDPQGIKELRDFIRRLAAEGMSLFISSHLLSEIQMMCDRVAIIHHGEVIAVGKVDELLRQTTGTVVWLVDDPERATAVFKEFAEMDMALLPHDHDELSDVTELAGAFPLVSQANTERIPDVARRLAEVGVKLYTIQIKNPTLEELFLSLTEGEAHD